MNIAETEQKIEELTKRITKARKDHKTSSKMVAEQKRLRNTILAHGKIKDFANKEKAKKEAVQQRVDATNAAQFDTYRPLGLTEQPTHEEIRRDRDAQRDTNHAVTNAMDNMFVSTSEAADLSDPNVRRKFSGLPPTLWQRVKSFFARWF